MKCLPQEDRELIRRARRYGREARVTEEKERMRKGAIVSSSPQGIQVGAQASKFGFVQLIECIIKTSWCETKNVPLVNKLKTILEGQRIDQKRKKGWWRGRRERIEKGSRDRQRQREKRQKGIELTIVEEDKEH